MKSNTIRALLLITIFFMIAVNSNAQKNVDSNAHHNLAVKWSPLGIYFGKLTLGGEYSIRKKQSITFNVGIPTGIQRNFDADNNTADAKSKTTSVMAGYRFYLGKSSMKGFYFEPYLKYLNNKLEGTFNYNNDNPPSIYKSSNEISTFGIGGQLGFQVLIAKRIVLDFFLVGPEANTAKESGSFTDVTNNIPWTPADAADAENNIKDVIEDIPIIGDKTEVKADQNSKTVFISYKGFLPGVRTGFSIGFRF
jgi:hypothetical protein